MNEINNFHNVSSGSYLIKSLSIFECRITDMNCEPYSYLTLQYAAHYYKIKEKKTSINILNYEAI